MDEKNENENENSNGFWLGLLIGGAIGAVAGYLFSSEDKKKALLELKEKGKMLLENIGEWKDEAVEKGEVVKKVVGEEIQDTAVVAKEAIQKVEKAAREAVEDISQSVETSVKTFNPKKKGFGKFFFKKGQALIKK